MDIYDMLQELYTDPRWTQERLSLRLEVSIYTVKSWTRKNPANRRHPNKDVLPKLNKILEDLWILKP